MHTSYIEQCLVGSEGDHMSVAVGGLASLRDLWAANTGVHQPCWVDIHIGGQLLVNKRPKANGKVCGDNTNSSS